MDRKDKLTPESSLGKGRSAVAPSADPSLHETNVSPDEGGSAPLGTLERGLHLLGLFTAERPSWTLRDFREESGLPKATVRRIVLTLERYGWLATQEGSGVYELGPLILQGLFAKTSASLLATLARPHLEELARRTTESALFAIWGHAGPLTLDLVTTHRHFKPFTSIGMVMEGGATADAQVLNAFASPAIREARLRTLISGDVEHREIDRSTMIDSWAKVREDGVAFDFEQWRQGVCAVAAPVLHGNGDVIASVSVVVPSERAGNEEMRMHAEAVREAALAISASLRGQALKAASR